MTIIQTIFDIMKRNNISQKQLSEYTGISNSAISAWKHKNAYPSSDKLPLIAECLGVSISELFESDENSNKVKYIETQNQIFSNDLVRKTYMKLTEKEKLKVQVYILDLAEQSGMSHAEVKVIE